RGFTIASLVDDEAPVATGRTRCAKVLEVERQEGEIVSLGVRHERRIGHPEVEVSVRSIELRCSSQQHGSEKCHLVFAGNQRFQETSCGPRSNPRPKEIIHLHDYGVEYDQLPTELRNEGGSQFVRFVPSVGSREEWAGVGEDPHRTVTGSRRYCSAIRP